MDGRMNEVMNNWIDRRVDVWMLCAKAIFYCFISL